MKILLLGECSNLHCTLAQGLRKLGHEVTVASDGSKWMDNRRDIDLNRDGYGYLNTIKFIYNLYSNLDKLKGYDVVQIKNPVFLDLKASRNLLMYKYLRKHNKKVFLGAFGNDYYWLQACIDQKTFRYSEFSLTEDGGYVPFATKIYKAWSSKDKIKATTEIARDVDGIIACLYEYYVAYQKVYPEKLTFIPEPVNTDELIYKNKDVSNKVLSFFIGIQADRSDVKGTDILYKCLQEVYRKHPERCVINKAESVPYTQYVEMMRASDVILDQLYSYTPGMNALAAMAQGLVVVGGGEPESYEILGEFENRPIINVVPDENDVIEKLEELVLNKGKIQLLSQKSREFIEKHHDYVKVAQQYINFWQSR